MPTSAAAPSMFSPPPHMLAVKFANSPLLIVQSYEQAMLQLYEARGSMTQSFAAVRQQFADRWRALARLLVGEDVVLPALGEVDERLGIGQRYLAGAAHGDRLEPFGSHHRADAARRRAMIPVVLDRCTGKPGLAGGPDAGDADLLLVAEFSLDQSLGLARVLPPQVGGIAQLDLRVVDPQIDGLARLSGDDDAVESGMLEVCRPEAVRVRGRGGVRRVDVQRDDGQVRRTGGRGAGQRSGHQHQRGLRVERADAIGRLVEQQLQPQAYATDETAQHAFVRQRGDSGRPGSQIDAQPLTDITTFHRRLRTAAPRSRRKFTLLRRSVVSMNALPRVMDPLGT